MWVYVAAGLVAAAAAFLLRRFLRDSSMKRIGDAWFCVVAMAGACYFLIYASDEEHSLLILGIGLICLVASALALLMVFRRTSGIGGKS